MCQYPLDQFASKLKKYERLDIRPQHGDSPSTSDRLKGWGRKVQWGVGMEKDVVELRAYIATHIHNLLEHGTESNRNIYLAKQG
ncbi:hypothetical protein CEP52_000967 [Fusarium oligoseptatum]|uniref:Uncharacterized protein n=1 Tax=Fusarium oligoseptatum TaxID=2604345 RepID=A0A428UKX5_9HYPO|nr:hypothetical protein CEP52_000967 [Fusarium oligoseptatum]